MTRRHRSYTSHRGKLLKYDQDGNHVETIPFKFDVARKDKGSFDGITGHIIQKGEFRIKTEDDIEPVKGIDKVSVNWREEPYLVSDSNEEPKPQTSGRRGRLRTTKEIYLE